jgi:2'-5' RNA ligase
MRMYFIALVFPEPVDAQVKKLKLQMRDRFNAKAALRSPAHITIIPPWWMDPLLEALLKNSLSGLARSSGSFDIDLKGFSSFPPKTLFIKVDKTEELQALYNKVNSYFKDLPGFGMKFDDRPFHPHVTIATRDLTKAAYKEAWALLERKQFQAQWRCDAISLLRLEEHGWDVVETIVFGQ